jgi:hypothetical protein
VQEIIARRRLRVVNFALQHVMAPSQRSPNPGAMMKACYFTLFVAVVLLSPTGLQAADQAAGNSVLGK